jgi:hypothetical protein
VCSASGGSSVLMATGACITDTSSDIIVSAPCMPAVAADAGAIAAAAWKASSLSELRWCGDVVFEPGPDPICLPRLLALEIE